MAHDSRSPDAPPALSRNLNLPQAISLNIANMVGVGPFITIPLMLVHLPGPQVVLAWVAAGLLVLCDGLIWSELGAALPGSGGSYHFLKEIYGPLDPKWGRLIPFLFIWQFLISGTLESASAYIGASEYLHFIFPGMDKQLAAWHVPYGSSTLAAIACLCVTALLCRHIRVLGWLSLVLCVGILGALLAVVLTGLPHVDPDLLRVPPGTFSRENMPHFANSLGAAMAIAIYNYFGYYNICYLGDEVRNPGQTIPRSVIGSVWIIGILYVAMTVAIIGVIPMNEMIDPGTLKEVDTYQYVAADLIERILGHPIAIGFAWLVIGTAVAGAFAMSLGYSRIPFAAARNGDFFKIFGTLHADGFPVVAILFLGVLTAVCCYLKLDVVVSAAVSVRILVQFGGQIVGLHLLRKKRPDVELPFRMWLYPLPSLIALVGWLFVLGTQEWDVIGVALAVTVTGVPAFLLWKMWTERRTAAQIPG
jgi:amino acid transporter